MNQPDSTRTDSCIVVDGRRVEMNTMKRTRRRRRTVRTVAVRRGATVNSVKKGFVYLATCYRKSMSNGAQGRNVITPDDETVATTGGVIDDAL